MRLWHVRHGKLSVIVSSSRTAIEIIKVLGFIVHRTQYARLDDQSDEDEAYSFIEDDESDVKEEDP